MGTLLLHTYKHMSCITFNRVFALIYTCAILALIYHHILTLLLLHSTTFISIVTTTSLLISDLILGVAWATTTSFRLRPILRKAYPENLEKVMDIKDFPAMDIFICTADPFKEPPMNVVNTALSLMAYDYPPEKMSVYVSDDGGSELTLFAFMEAAKFAKIWLPFCREHNIMDRCPEVYFRSDPHGSDDELQIIEEIKAMYENMKIRVENVVERGEVCPYYITNELQRQAFNQYRTPGFTRANHPTIIQVLIESAKEKDQNGQSMPNLIYVSRQKNKNAPHNFKAGALNSLLRVSSIMTNAPIVLTQDCDMCSNDPQTPKRALCYILDPSGQPELGYVQFPQRFSGLNKDDIYGGEVLRLFLANPVGMDGLQGPHYVGTGCFFLRRAFFGGPTSMVPPERQELRPDHVVEKPITAQPIIELAHYVARCNYENNTKWGFQIGFRYGSLVEDYFTGYKLQCEGWKSIFCHPSRPAFLGDAPFSLIDSMSQSKRWAIGHLEVFFSRYMPMFFGARYMGIVMGLCYAHNAFWPIWSIPITIYSFLPQLALLNGFYIFPKVTDWWFLLYVFLFLGAYAQDCYDFILFGSTYKRWWNDQRMWIIKGLSPYVFAFVEYTSKRLGIATEGFNVTSKVQDDEQSKRYDQGLMEFGVHSPMFIPLATASIVNLFALIIGIIRMSSIWSLDTLFVQLFIASFGVLNSWPVYEAMVLRKDKGRMHVKTIVISICLASALCVGASLAL
ncbi:putative cellulose synthase (UDP-forming) [Helianthus annuus]|uniref:Cellulose synthase (UDP-forming) n=1 Tax=Helianthus annuus TaxID=4232 RepID=A0A251VAL2_HELAN|nr:cellulose synthase-like protein G3 [Helianthus annuus]KAF5815938.1 putative cellulose synthase (UDP-forming) [Helianthus annuus]